MEQLNFIQSSSTGDCYLNIKFQNNRELDRGLDFGFSENSLEQIDKLKAYIVKNVQNY